MLEKVNLKYNFEYIIEQMDTSSRELVVYEDDWNSKEAVAEDESRYNNAQHMTAKNTLVNMNEYDESQLDFEDIGKQLGMKVVCIWTMVQRPGQILPLHTDKHVETKAKLPDHPGTLCRCVIHIQDWKPGQFLDYSENRIDTGWKQGQGLKFGPELPHLSANCGEHNKYTMQVSGYATSNFI
jgi:hypothetical protein